VDRATGMFGIWTAAAVALEIGMKGASNIGERVKLELTLSVFEGCDVNLTLDIHRKVPLAAEMGDQAASEKEEVIHRSRQSLSAKEEQD